MKYQVLFSLKNNERVFLTSYAAGAIGALKIYSLVGNIKMIW